MKTKRQNLSQLITMAMLIALSVVFIALIRFPIFPSMPYLVFDAGDIPLLIGSYIFGPWWALLMVAISAGFQAIFLSTDGLIGFLMHFIASGVLVVVAGCIYRPKQTRKRALLSLICATCSMALIMIPCNLVFTVNFYGVPMDVVVASMPLTIAFNLIKAGINSTVVFLIYKPLSVLFQKASASQPKKQSITENTPVKDTSEKG